LTSPWNAVKEFELSHDVPAVGNAAVGELRVGCYNIAVGRGGSVDARNWDGGDRETKIERVRQMGRLLREAGLDIVVLNEVDFSSYWSGNFDQAKLIAEEAGLPYLVEQRNTDVSFLFECIRSGNAILSRYPITGARFVNYPNYSPMREIFVGGPKEGVVCIVDLPDGSQIRVFAVHLAVRSEALRVESARIILDTLGASDIPMLAMGDFNGAPAGYPLYYQDESGRNALEILMKDQRLSTLPAGPPVNPKDFTYPSADPDRVIDWIFVSDPWKIADKTVLTSDLSDHLPLIARLIRVEEGVQDVQEEE